MSRRCSRRTCCQICEKPADFFLPDGVAPGAQDAHGLVAGPNGPTRGGVSIEEGHLSLVKRGPDPGKELIVLGHVPSMLPHAKEALPEPVTVDSPAPSSKGV